MALNENAQKWVAALRSGEYEQGTGKLCADGKYCCLGIACEVAIQNGVTLAVTKISNGVVLYGLDYGVLPGLAAEWLGLNSRTGVFEGNKELTVLNDGGKSFAEIADIIESEPEGLFVSRS